MKSNGKFCASGRTLREKPGGSFPFPIPGDTEHREKRPYTSRTAMSLTLVPVGPVIISPPQSFRA